MEHPAKRGFRLAITTIGFGVLFLALNAVPGAATPPQNFGSAIVARGTYVDHGTLALPTGLDVVVSMNTVQPGGSSGWHSHPGGAIVVIQQGQMTLNYSVGGHCQSTTYTAGQSFVERPSDVVNAVNTGSTVTIIYATFPGVPVGGSPRIDRPNPGTCPGI
jgi:quercetin dioxygenase-like cupin family protein